MKHRPEIIEKLVDVISKLRDPVSGCPWDKEQTHESLKPYLIEETYEVLEAIDNKSHLKEELGDVLLQIVLHSQLSSEKNEFDFYSVCEELTHKLIKRHPHVFGDTVATTTSQVLENWEAIKKSDTAPSKSTLDSIPKALPALLRAHRIGEKTARLGFDWTNSEGVETKVREELSEFLEAMKNRQKNEAHVQEEFGDLLFTLAQLSRKMDLNSEEILSKACTKFTSRFRRMEQLAGGDVKSLSRERLECYWEAAKKEETIGK